MNEKRQIDNDQNIVFMLIFYDIFMIFPKEKLFPNFPFTFFLHPTIRQANP